MSSSVNVDGTKIRELRTKKVALERKEVAQMLGLSQAAIYEIEVHRQRTRLTTLRKLAKILQVKPEELVV